MGVTNSCMEMLGRGLNTKHPEKRDVFAATVSKLAGWLLHQFATYSEIHTVSIVFYDQNIKAGHKKKQPRNSTLSSSLENWFAADSRIVVGYRL